MSGHRMDRVNADAQKEIAQIIRELKDPRIPEMVSVVAVHITPDLRHAKVYISSFGGGDETKETVHALNSAAGFVRKELGHRMQMRYTPQVTFEEDDSIAYGAHISEILHNLNREDKK